MSLVVMTGKHETPDLAIIHRYFWPQNYPYAVMLKSIAEGMSEAGLKVSVYSCHEPGTSQDTDRASWASSIGAYSKSIPKGSERRYSVFKKAFSAICYSAWVFWVASRCKAKVVWIGSTPPILMPVVVRCARIFRDFRIVYHCQDIHPEALVLNGNISDGWQASLLKALDKSSVQSVDSVITLSDDMKYTLARRPSRINNVRVINNFIFEQRSVVNTLTKARRPPFKLLFAGSLGRFQNLNHLVEVCIELAKKEIAITTFMGDGPLKESMEKSVAKSGLHEKVRFTGQRPLDEALSEMERSDFGLVSLSQGVDRVAYPSKTLMYFSVGLPCIAFVSQGSDLERMINDERLGFATESKDVAESVDELSEFLLYRSKDVLASEEIANFSNVKFSKKVVVDQMVDVVKELVN